MIPRRLDWCNYLLRQLGTLQSSPSAYQMLALQGHSQYSMKHTNSSMLSKNGLPLPRSSSSFQILYSHLSAQANTPNHGQLRFLSSKPPLPKPPTPRPPSNTNLAANPIPETPPPEGKIRSIITKIRGLTLQGMWKAFVHELHHYWTGTKLLAANVGVSKDLTLKLLNGQVLSRREKRLLRRTTLDVLRVFPFLLFVVVPFLEFTLPIFLKLFPNMLPSTFESSLQREEKMRQSLKVKLEVAKFLQETVTSGSLEKNSANDSQEVSQIMERIRSGQELSSTDIIQVAHLFKNDFALENLDRDQLVAICKFLNLQTLGTNAFLRFRLTARMKELQDDDAIIQEEGLDILTIEELQAACAARGMRSLNLSESVLRRQLNQWLELSLKERLPVALIVISRVLTITTDPSKQPVATKSETLESIKNLISQMSSDLLDEVKLEALLNSKGDSIGHLHILNDFRQAMKNSTSGKPDAELVKSFAEQLDSESDRKSFYETLVMISSPSPFKLQKETLDESIQQLDDSHAPDEEGQKLASRVKSLMTRLEKELTVVDSRIAGSLHLLDRDGDGIISPAELKVAFSRLSTNIPPQDLKRLFDQLDTDHDGLLNVADIEKLVLQLESIEKKNSSSSSSTSSSTSTSTSTSSTSTTPTTSSTSSTSTK